MTKFVFIPCDPGEEEAVFPLPEYAWWSAGIFIAEVVAALAERMAEKHEGLPAAALEWAGVLPAKGMPSKEEWEKAGAEFTRRLYALRDAALAHVAAWESGDFDEQAETAKRLGEILGEMLPYLYD